MDTIEQIQDSLIELYIATFNRAPDADGLVYWTAKIQDDNWSIDKVAQSFFDSQEVAIKYPPTLSNEEFINTIYNNVLGRDADTAGLEYWLGELQMVSLEIR